MPRWQMQMNHHYYYFPGFYFTPGICLSALLEETAPAPICLSQELSTRLAPLFRGRLV